MSYSRRPLTGLEILIVLAILAFFILFTPIFLVAGVNTSSSMFNRYTIQGVVDGEVGAKLKISQDSGTTKYSVPLVTGRIKQIINCTSTQCAALSPGDEVSFSCYEEWHLFTPNEEECRFETLL